MIICVTGKIGTGKSTVSSFFEKLGFVYINVDKLGHRAFELNKELIKREFGTSDRKEVGKIVFSDSKKLEKLESLVHPTMKMLFNEEIQRFSSKDIIIEAAIKRRLNINCCDFIITVVSDTEIIKERLKDRYTPDLIDEILKRQEDVIEEGIVVRNNGTIEELNEKLRVIWEEYIQKGKKKGSV